MQNELLNRLKRETNEADSAILQDLLADAGQIILNRRYPYKAMDIIHNEVPLHYRNLQYRIALELYSKRGAEGEIQHIENGVHRNYSSADVSPELLREIVPMVGGF